MEEREETMHTLLDELERCTDSEEQSPAPAPTLSAILPSSPEDIRKFL